MNPNSVLSFLSGARKAVAAAVGVAVTLLSAYHQLPGLPDQPLVVAALAFLTTVATYLVPNKS